MIFDLGTFPEGADIPLVAYFELPNSQPLASSLVQAVSGPETGFDVNVYWNESVSPETAVYSLLTQDPASAGFNPDVRAVLIATPATALTVDGYWRRNSIGYNVRFTLDEAVWNPMGGQSYIAELTFHTTNFGAVTLRFRFQLAGEYSIP
jgi:hypothetical protein